MKLFDEKGLEAELTTSRFHDYEDPNYGHREPLIHEQHKDAREVRSAHQQNGLQDKSFNKRWPDVWRR